MAIDEITVGVDRSPLAANALTWALDLAAAANSKVRAVATWQMPMICLLPGPIQGLPGPEFMQQQCSESLTKTVAEANDDRPSPSVDVQEIVAEGKPGPMVVEAAQGTDLLVVGRTGQGKRQGISRVAEIALGSTARYCIHHADIPVATIPSGATWTSEPHVVVGVDGSTQSLAALEWALTTLPVDSSIHVVRAFEPWVGDGLIPQDLIGVDEIYQQILDETRAWVGDVLERVSPRKEPEIEAVIATAQYALTHHDYPVDLIVVGERGRTAVSSFVLGSVSDYLVRYADGPVIVVPST